MMEKTIINIVYCHVENLNFMKMNSYGLSANQRKIKEISSTEILYNNI